MARFIALFGTILLIGTMFYLFLQFISLDKSKKVKEVKKDSEYWWYNSPHYYIMSNGEKFNIAEYVTYEDWKNLDQSHKNRLLLQIEHRILITKKDDFLDSSSKDI